jgi:hypothetical protein
MQLDITDLSALLHDCAALWKEHQELRCETEALYGTKECRKLHFGENSNLQ